MFSCMIANEQIWVFFLFHQSARLPHWFLDCKWTDWFLLFCFNIISLPHILLSHPFLFVVYLVHFGVDSYYKSCELVMIANEQIWVFYITICNTATLFYWFFLFCCLVLHFVVDWYDKSCELVHLLISVHSQQGIKKKLLCLCLIKGHKFCLEKKLLHGCFLRWCFSKIFETMHDDR